MSTILGLDLSLTSTGWCVLKDGKIEKTGTIKTKSKGMKRLQYIKNEINSIRHRKKEVQNEDMVEASRNQINLIAIEGYSMGSQKGQVFSIGELGGIIKYFMWISDIEIIIVPPQTLKKFVAGKGGFKKNMMMMKAFKKYGIDFKNDDECDAFCLAKMGQAYLEGTNIKYEQEALKKVEVLK
jgi:Holliday junction resolvasome RuvABC endonuclease subunit